MTKTKPGSLILAGIVILALLYQFVCAPGIRKIRQLNVTYQQKQKDLQSLKGLISQYRERTTVQPFVFAPEDFSLYLFVSKAVENVGSKSKISRITPVTENILLNTIEQHINIAIEEIELENLLLFLEEIEKRDFLRYGYLQISKNPQKPFVVKAEMELICYKPKTQ